MKRWKCDDCGYIVNGNDFLFAPSPFDTSAVLQGCPGCCQPVGVTVRLLCDEPGCNELQSSGWPSAEGYRNTCHIHSDWYLKNKASTQEPAP